MFQPTIMLALLSAMAFALPRAPHGIESSEGISLTTRGGCSSNTYPLDTTYYKAVTDVCAALFHPNNQEISIPPIEVWTTKSTKYDKPVSTYDQKEQTIRFEMSVSCEHCTSSAVTYVTEVDCINNFTNIMREGKSSNYCTVSGTQDLLFKGGHVNHKLPVQGTLVYTAQKL